MSRRLLVGAMWAVVVVAGCECGQPPANPPQEFSVRGTVEGLSGSGLVLQNNGGDDVTVSANGEFAFPTKVASGSPYAVTVLKQPTGPAQTCEVTKASGTMGDADVTDVSVKCTVNTYAIGGTVAGYEGTGLSLQNNDGEELAISTNGEFTFPTKLASGQTFTVTVKSQPTTPSQTCVVAGGSGTIVDGDVKTITVNCGTNTYTVGGTVTGLEGMGLELENEGVESVQVSANGTFAFPTPVSSGATFKVTVKTQPSTPTQTCTVTGGEGTVGGGNVSSIAVVCVTNAYTVGGTVSGLEGTGLVLQNNLGDNLPITADGAFTFSMPVESGEAFDVTVSVQPTSKWQTCTVTNGSGTIAAANVTNVQITCVTNLYTVGGTVTGLSGSGLTLQNSAGDDLAISADGAFTFATSVASGESYDVTVFAQPSNPWQTCVVAGGTGTVGGSDVTSITVDCVTNEYTVGGTVSGLAGSGLSVQLNGGAAISLSANGTWAFPTTVQSGATYAVTIATQPQSPWQTCSVSNDSGTVSDADVSNVTITCVTNTYAVGGTVTGLSGSGLKLQNNAGDEITVTSSGTFTFPTQIASGQGYAVTVSAQPTTPWQTCTVTNGSGNVTNAAVTTVEVACVTNTYAVGGTVSGLAGTLTLHNNGGDALVLTANGAFQFPTALESGTNYAVTVATQPGTPSQTCTVASGTGTVTNANITSVAVTCVTNSYSVGGTVSGLSGTGLVLTNNGGDAITISANGSFTFPAKVLSGSQYLVAVQTQPASPYQTCSVSGGSGTMGGANVTSVSVNCTTNTYTVGGTVSGLLGAGLTLTTNGQTLAVNANGSFAFPTPVQSGATYAVSVSAQPQSPWQTCVVANGSGTVTNSNVTSVSVTCTRNNYNVKVTVSGLSGSGLVLQNNSANNLSVPSNGTYTFSTPVGSGLTYNVTVLTQPTSPSQTCTVASPTGTMGGADVTLTATCVTNTYSIGGTVTGASGSGLVLRLNGGNNLSVPGNGAFTFPTQIASGQTYSVTVFANPGSQICSVTNGSGTVTSSNVTNVTVTCTSLRPNILQCGSSSRPISTFVPSGVTLTTVVSCTPDSNTQAIFVTRGGAGSVNAAVFQNYLNNGGIVLTEYSITTSVFNAVFGTAAPAGGFFGSCWDTAPTVVQFSPADPFWQNNTFTAIPLNQSGCGQHIGGLPGITPIAGWSSTAVSIGYRDLGLGRFWATDFDWQDNESVSSGIYAYTNSLMGYMLTHRR